MGFFITILVGFILGILFDRFIASEELDAIVQMIIPTEKDSIYKYKKCQKCGEMVGLSAIRANYYLDPSTGQSYTRCTNCGNKTRLGIQK